MSVVQHASNKAVFSSGTSGTVTVTLGSATGAGNCLVACVTASNAASTTPSVTAVKTGSSAENWAAAKTVNDTTQSGYATIWTDQNTGGGATTVVVTVSFGQTDSGSAETSATVDVYEVSGVLSSGAVDASAASSTGNSGTSWSSGASGTTAQASEIAFGVTLCVPTSGGTGTVTGPSGWTNSTALSQAYTGSFGSYTLYGLSGYQTLSATGTVTYNGTASTASYWDTCAVTLKYSTTVSGAAGLYGEGTMSGSGAFAGQASLNGEGTLGGTGAFAGTAGLGGAGTLSASGSVTGAQLAGAGSLAAAWEAAQLAGGGTMTAAETLAGLAGAGQLGATGAFAGAAGLNGGGKLQVTQFSYLAGAGSLYAVPSTWYAALNGAGGITENVTLKLTKALFGAGYLSIPEVAGGLVSGTGGAAFPQALAGSSQVAVAPPGSSNWQWIGTFGQVTSLTYSFATPGGCDKLSMTVMVPASFRNQMFNPGWQVKVTRGGHQVWYGKLDEPVPSAQGWTLTAVGAGNLGANYLAYYAPGDTWPTGVADDMLNRAISRGLPWTNPGISASPYYSQMWFGQAQDPASMTVTAFLNLICIRGALTWYVSSQPGGPYGGNNLSIFPLPTVPNRLLTVTTPVSRTLGGDINYIFIRYQSSADNTTTNTAAAYSYTSAQNSASIAAHQETEAFLDLSNAGTLTQAQAQAVGNSVLQLYQRASFAGPFTARYGDLMTTGGQPVDPGTDQSGTCVRLVLTDYGYGGEVVPGPIAVVVGNYEWDDFAQTATIKPMPTVDASLSGLLSMVSTTMTPVTAAG